MLTSQEIRKAIDTITHEPMDIDGMCKFVSGLDVDAKTKETLDGFLPAIKAGKAHRGSIAVVLAQAEVETLRTEQAAKRGGAAGGETVSATKPPEPPAEPTGPVGGVS